jgi:hypothetical protein
MWEPAVGCARRQNSGESKGQLWADIAIAQFFGSRLWMSCTRLKTRWIQSLHFD